MLGDEGKGDGKGLSGEQVGEARNARDALLDGERLEAPSAGGARLEEFGGWSGHAVEGDSGNALAERSEGAAKG